MRAAGSLWHKRAGVATSYESTISTFPINESAPLCPRDPIVKVNCNVSPVVISQAEIVEKGQPSLAGMFSPVRNSSLNFSQLQSSFHTTSSPGSPGSPGSPEQVGRIFFICIHSLV